MRFASLGSGSKGNATLVEAGDNLLLVDCGFSLRETTRRLHRLGVEPAQIDAILVTHEHSDHAAGVPALSRKHAIPVYLSYGTNSTGRCDAGEHTRCFNGGDAFCIGGIDVEAVAVPHDAREPCQFRFRHRNRSLGLLTDLGSITPHVVASYRDCDALLLEFNHDLDMLMTGAYPPQLKRRVGGDWGHLNNHQAAGLLQQLDGAAPECLVVAHVSEQNNSRDLAEQALAAVSRPPAEVLWAGQGEGFDWRQL
jgi:phosphoribosyl 1,2-cyclic phosphodiesterase